MWKLLKHRNILSLIGVSMSESHFGMVSDWMTNEDINKFIKMNPNADRIKLVGYSLTVLPSPR
jgi:hypothetical protein